MTKEITVIPAVAGVRCIYQDESDGSLFVSDCVIAWRIESEIAEHDGEYRSHPHGITTGGDADSDGINFYGYLFPDGRVECPYTSSFDNLEQAQTDARRWQELTKARRAEKDAQRANA